MDWVLIEPWFRHGMEDLLALCPEGKALDLLQDPVITQREEIHLIRPWRDFLKILDVLFQLKLTYRRHVSLVQFAILSRMPRATSGNQREFACCIGLLFTEPAFMLESTPEIVNKDSKGEICKQ